MIEKEKLYASVFGSSVFLIGTRHERMDDMSCEASETQLYRKIQGFDPDLILLEAEGFDSNGNRKDTTRIQDMHNADIYTINQYSDDKRTKLVRYDKELVNDLQTYDKWLDSDVHEELSNSTPDEKRSIIRDQDEGMYKDLYQQRENHAYEVFISEMRKHNKIVVHCGVSHFTSHKSFFDMLKYDNVRS